MNKYIAKVIAGSRLYGLNNESSDYDEKHIFVPPLNELILRRASHNINEKKENVEFEGFSIQSFLNHCVTGQDVAMVLLHAPQDKIILDSDIYKYLRDNKKRFYTKKINGSLQFSRSQACKYALRADRMNSVKKAVDKMQELVDRGVVKLWQAWDELPEDENLKKIILEDSREDNKNGYNVSGKICSANTNPTYCLEFLSQLLNRFGDRVRVAANLNSLDYKSISHAFRTSYQLLHIYKDGGFEFPLPETEFLKSIKYGKEDFLKNEIDAKLNSLISEVEGLAAQSNYPDAVDQKWIDSIILTQYSGATVNIIT